MDTTEPIDPTEPSKPSEPTSASTPTQANTTFVPNYPTPDLVLGAEAKYYLHTAGRWATFLGIMGFIGTGFIILMAIFVGTIFSFIGKFSAGAAMPSAATGFITFFYLLIAVFYFFWAFYMYQFGASIKKGVGFNDPLEATKAFKNIKSNLKLVGISTIVFLSIYALIFVIAIIIGIARA